MFKFLSSFESSIGSLCWRQCPTKLIGKLTSGGITWYHIIHRYWNWSHHDGLENNTESASSHVNRLCVITRTIKRSTILVDWTSGHDHRFSVWNRFPKTINRKYPHNITSVEFMPFDNGSLCFNWDKTSHIWANLATWCKSYDTVNDMMHTSCVFYVLYNRGKIAGNISLVHICN